METFSIENRELPSLLIGSSPFCGAGQFREKAPVYFDTFFRQPTNITKLLVKACRMGYPGAHLLAYAPIAGAALDAYKILGYRFPVIITLAPEESEEQWKWIRNLDTAAVLMHAFETDKLDIDSLKRFSGECRKNGVIPGLSTHNGGYVIPMIDQSGIDVAVYLCPFNKTGAHVHPSLESTLAAIQNTDKKVIGMKVLSCGELAPAEAFEFSLPHVDAVTVGMVAEEEIEENCREFGRFHHLLGAKRRLRSS